MLQGNLLPSFWAEAVNAASYIRNRCPTNALNGNIPYEKWTKKILKLDPRSREGVLVRYPVESKGYRIWIPLERKVIVTRDVKFVRENSIKGRYLEVMKEIEGESREAEVLDLEIVKQTSPQKIPKQMSTSTVQDPQPESKMVRAPGRSRLLRSGGRGRPKKLFKTRTEEISVSDYENEVEIDTNDLQDDVFMEYAGISEVSVHEALNGDEREEWEDAIYSEVKNLVKNDNFDIIKRSENENLVGSRLVLTNKVG